MRSIEGNHALVTGAASGIGLAVAFELAARGAHLTLVDLDEARLEAAEKTLAEQFPRCRVVPMKCNVADEWCVADLAKRVSRGPEVDLLVSNAGIAVVAPFNRTTPQDWDRVLGVNLHGGINLAREFVPRMTRRGRGQLTFVASMAGLVPAPGMVAYGTSKFALVGFAQTLRLELEGTGVGVTTVCPGYVRTRLHANTRYENDGFQQFLDKPPRGYGMEADDVAQRIVDASISNRAMLALGPEKTGWWLYRLAPRLGLAAARSAGRMTGVLQPGIAQ